ncbi:type III pantothenate kinase [Lachnospiraceae bacterium HCP1S3_C3]|nr:type III pantothenate kinase [Lachnospiraceae bacterium]
MLLVIDIGNTNVTFGVFEKKEIKTTFRITTKIPRTSDEYGLLICDLLLKKSVDIDDIEDIIISSVVPNVMHSFQNGIIKYLNKKPIVVEPGTKTGIKITLTNPREVGADRIVDAVGAYFIYGGPVLVIDYGTATTYDYISGDGAFSAGVITTGIRSSAKELSQDAAKLPEIEIKRPDTILAKDTIRSMQAGLFYGYVGQTEYIIDKFKDETGISDMKVVATGGLGKIISEATEKIDYYDANLTLHGLRILYEKYKSA